MSRFKKYLGIVGLVSAFAAAVLSPEFSHSQNVSQPANPDTMFCNTRGSIATRLATRWQCLTPGTAGQVLKTNGPGADAGWLTVTGTGTVTSVGATVPAFLTVTGSPVTTSGTLAISANSQTANQFLAAPNGVAGVPGFRAMVSADVPAANLASSANGGVTGVLPVANGGTNASAASGTVLDNITGFAGTGILRRTGAGTYTQGTTVSVAEGGTGGTTASGTLLDNITGFSTTGVMQRTGAGAYSFSTIPAILGSQTANTIFAAPNGSAGNPAFRAMVSADIPASVALTGTPTAPTATAGTNTTQIATTAFVTNAINTLPSGPTFVTKTSDQSVTGTALTNDTGLTFSMAASTRYRINVHMLISYGMTGGFVFGFSQPGGATSTREQCSAVYSTAASSGNSTATGAGPNSIISVSSPPGTNGTIDCVIYIENGTTAGTFSMAIAQQTNNATATVVYRGSNLDYMVY